MAKKNKKEMKEEVKNQNENLENENQEQPENIEEITIEDKTKEESDCTSEENEFEELQKKYTELNDKYLRISAEFDNYRKRTLKEKMDLIKGGGSDVLKSILPIVDNFERALKALDEVHEFDALREGVILIYKDFKGFLEQRGVTEIESIGLVLDTDLHEAIAQFPVEEDEKKGKIIDVVEKGYMLNEKVLRFAKVVVAQ
ncbi:MAG: nucleotide exchange factor GrpE [Bacteroidales bacterium]|nr:nucleotide exchange factor GrpE [Bacteroidales bacterium]